MTPPRFGPNIMPDPVEVARRADAVSYFYSFESSNTTDKSGRQEVFFGLASDRTASTAVVNVLRFSAAPRTIDGSLEPIDCVRRECANIGYYDPARQEWIFYPECIMPEERQYLGDELEETASRSHAALAAESRTDNPTLFIDVRNPATVYARNEMASLLLPTRVAERLITDNPIDGRGQLRQMDEATTYTLVLAPKIIKHELEADAILDEPEQYAFKAEQALSIAYSGLIVSKRGNVKRMKKQIPIAHRQDDGVMWAPDLKVITTEEWQVLGRATQMLEDYKEQYPNFSAECCAVAHNLDYY